MSWCVFEKLQFVSLPDIEGVFHQIRVREDSLRFLWWTNSCDVYVMQVHSFGAASSPCIAKASVQRVADDNAEDFSSSVIAAVRMNFYVDDVLRSANDEQSTIHLAQDMVVMLTRDGFNVTKFTSNSREVLKAVPSKRYQIRVLISIWMIPPLKER